MLTNNPLTALPVRFRKYAYALLMLAAIVLGAVKIADGDWLEATIYVLGALGFTTATSNTHVE